MEIVELKEFTYDALRLGDTPLEKHTITAVVVCPRPSPRIIRIDTRGFAAPPLGRMVMARPVQDLSPPEDGVYYILGREDDRMGGRLDVLPVFSISTSSDRVEITATTSFWRGLYEKSDEALCLEGEMKAVPSRSPPDVLPSLKKPL